MDMHCELCGNQSDIHDGQQPVLCGHDNNLMVPTDPDDQTEYLKMAYRHFRGTYVVRNGERIDLDD